jgi:hypothetical protein
MAVQLESAARLAALRDKADAVTGERSATLAGAVDALIAGFGSGAGGDNLLDYAGSIQAVFAGCDFGGVDELIVSFGSKFTPRYSTSGKNSSIYTTAFSQTKGVRRITVKCGYDNPSSQSMNSFMHENGGCETLDISNISPLSINNARQMFNGAGNLREIIGELDLSGCTQVYNSFSGTSSLETVRFTEESLKASISFSSSPNLTAESIQSIVDGLADLTGGTAQTLTLHATVGAKLTDAQKTAISAKNWTVTY